MFVRKAAQPISLSGPTREKLYMTKHPPLEREALLLGKI
jgi:hypothetical protein